MCNLLEKYFNFLNKYEKPSAKESDSNFEDYRDINPKEKTEYINNKLNMLPIHEELSKLDLNETQLDYDATNLYRHAMWDQNSVNPKKESGFVFKPDMNDV